MHTRQFWIGLTLLFVALVSVACAQPAPTAAPTVAAPPTEAPQPTEVIVTGSASQGGRVYDTWWKEAGVDEPTGDQPLWADQSTNTRSGPDTWRCKECHGWDYIGADGAYGSGSHSTGFAGVFEAAGSHSPAELLAALNGTTNADHDFSAMGDEALGSLVVFLKEGLVGVAPYIDVDTKAGIGGDAAHGQELFSSACSACHDADGRLLNFGDEDEPEYVGTIAADNPWEFIHKVRVGQPGTTMPAAIESGWTMQDVVDVLTYAQTLPTEAPPTGSVSRGGRLYDTWWSEAGLDTPTADQPLWASQSTNTRSGTDTWRCKECHGWDYKGTEGAYGSGSHFTGFAGLLETASKSFDELVAILTGKSNAAHDFSAMGDDSLADLASFLKEGTLDVGPYINAETKAAIGGDAAHGQELFSSVCTTCHGADGRLLNFGDATEPEYVGTIAGDNPWEFIHKVRLGQPGTQMPAAIDSGWSLEDVIDLLTFAQTLPAGAP